MKILRISSSLKNNNAQSSWLGNKIIEKIALQKRITVTEKNLAKNEMPQLNQIHLTAFSIAQDQLSTEQKKAKSFSDSAINELLEADIVVIEVPMYNFTIPSTLKAWIDHVVRAGVTFRYTDVGVEGLVNGKKVYLAIASGGIYSKGSMKEMDFTEKYLKTILGFIGITDIVTFRVEGTAIPGFQETALINACELVDNYQF